MEGLRCILGTNQALLAYTTHPRSPLKKKSYAICYRYMREGCARMEAIAAYMKSFDDIADLLPKHRLDFQGRHYLLREEDTPTHI